MQVALLTALMCVLHGAPPDANGSVDQGNPGQPSPPDLPALELPVIEEVDNPLVPPPPQPGDPTPPPPADGQGAGDGSSPSDASGAAGRGDTRSAPPHGGAEDLHPIQVGDDRRAATRRHRLRDRQTINRLRLVDLRDPFERRGRPGGINRALTARFILPDLKDPFAIKRRPRPKNWTAPELPVDIRDPFSGNAMASHRPGCAPIRTKTESGVTIQRPSAKKDEVEQQKASRQRECAELQQRDLRDPFNSR